MRLLGIVGLLFLGILGTALPAQAGTTTVLRTPIEGVLTADCANAEPVVFSGTYRSVTTFTLDGSGNAHFSGTVSTSGRGIGQLTGTNYIFAGASSSSTQTVVTNVASHNSFTNTFVLVSAGGTENLLMHVTLHLTVTPAGTVSAEVESIRLACTG
jgi:hypothetical protein